MTEWVKIYTKELYAFTQTRIADVQSAEDIVQNTFLAALESYPRFERKSNPRTWLFAILKNKIADFLRQKYKDAEMKVSIDPLDICFDEDGSWRECHRPNKWHIDEELLDDAAFLEVLKNCFSHLPSKWSSAVQLKYVYEHSSKEICNELQITLANFWQMIHRAKVMLRFCLESNWLKSA